MPKVTVRGSGKKIDCNQGNFVAQGGEGAIHIIGNTVYKICNDPSNMIPDGKFQELRVLDHPRIVVPQEVLLDSKNRPTGYTMNAVPGNPMPLAKILTKNYRQRENVTPDMMFDLVKQMVDGITYIHNAGATVGDYLQVDGNELNYMVTDDHKEVYFIDTNSYQTPHFPADAIMLSIRDWSVGKDSHNQWEWSPLSDAYSFAIISFYMFTAIHPFMGRHPHCTDPKTMMTENMKHNKSVFDPETKFPIGAVFPFEDVIPGGASGEWMQWYKAIFVEGKRLPIPGTTGPVVIAFVPKVKEIKGTGQFTLEEVKDYPSMVTQYADRGGRTILVTKDQVFVDGSPKAKPADKIRVGFTQQKNIAVAAWLDEGKLKLHNMDSLKPIRCDLSGRSLMACEGRLYVLGQQDVFEITYVEASGNPIAAASPVASVMPHATDLYQGVVVQDMLGATMVSVFTDTGHHRQYKMDKLKGFRITEAKYEGGVLMVVGIHKTEGHYNRFVFRFSKDWVSYDCRVVENITPTGLNFTVTDAGICVCINELSQVEIISNKKDHDKVTQIDDPDINGDMRLCHTGAQVRLAYGEKLYNFSMKK